MPRRQYEASWLGIPVKELSLITVNEYPVEE